MESLQSTVNAVFRLNPENIANMTSSGHAMAAVAFIVWAQLTHTVASEESDNTTSNYVSILNRHGEEIFVSEELMSKLRDEAETWHWMPYLRIRTVVEDNVMRETCNTADPLQSFPNGVFDDHQLRHGAFLFYLLFGVCCFVLLAFICNDYFIPCVEIICEEFKIPQNVAAATFMSVATSCPEFFVNVISTFLTESDMGIGTIVGSAIFNALGVGAIGGIAAIAPIAIERNAVTRDVIIYMINLSVLVGIVWDGRVEWYEAVVLGVMYILYFVVMFNSIRIFNLFRKIFKALTRSCRKNKSNVFVITDSKSDEKGTKDSAANTVSVSAKVAEDDCKPVEEGNVDTVATRASISGKEAEDDEDDRPMKIWTFPKERSLLYKIWWTITFPLRLVLSLTIPSPYTCRRFYFVAFVICIVWIGINSYFVSWSMTIIGNTFFIPDSIMGMTFLAFGGCLPEACSMFIMSRRGKGGIGVSNALGGNSLAILFALGLPWLIKTLTLLVEGEEVTSVHINSAGIDFVVGSLLVAVVCLWIVLYFSKFYLRKSMGFVLAVLYVIFIVFAILVEMGIVVTNEVICS